MKLYGTATVGAKGQIVIPAEAREDFKLDTGDKVLVMATREGHMLGLCPARNMNTWLEEMRTHLDSLEVIAKADTTKN